MELSVKNRQIRGVGKKQKKLRRSGQALKTSFFAFFVATSAFMILACSHGYSVDDLIGVWKTEDAGRLFRIEFRRDLTFEFRVIEDSGIEHVIDGSFEGDFSKSPIPLTLRDIPQLDHPLHTIVAIRDDQLILGGFSARWRERPISFSETDTMAFRRSSSR